MHFKSITFLLCFFIFSASRAQKIVLIKMNSLNTKYFNLPKTLKINYRTDSSSFYKKGKAYKYEFPYIYIKTKKDTSIFDVRKIDNVIYTSDLLPMNIFALFFTANISVLMSIETIKTGHLTYFAGVIPAVIISGLLIDGFKTRLDTKSKWSFVNPKENK